MNDQKNHDLQHQTPPISARQIAVFHTHLAALDFFENICDLGDPQAMLVPVPRKLSVSCGTGVAFFLPFSPEMMVEDLMAVYLEKTQGKYELLWESPE